MNKRAILIFLAGWAVAVVIPPQRLIAMVRGK